ncbi:hypothetical protein AB0395_42165 [Streptosporangium sp. NPDC051023]|uniref:hypothetical protein n=1 Tax=Streptosporangium sp. NPDC051023 TaxID=3155410 RepID=UPI00344FC017
MSGTLRSHAFPSLLNQDLARTRHSPLLMSDRQADGPVQQEEQQYRWNASSHQQEQNLGESDRHLILRIGVTSMPDLVDYVHHHDFTWPSE